MANTFDPSEAYKMMEDMVSKGQAAFQSAFGAGSENAQKGFEKFATSFQDQAGKAQEAFSKSYEEMTQLNQANMDVAMKCGTAVAKSAETIGQAAADVTKKNFEAGMAHAKALASAKDINEVINLNTTFARTQMDQIVSEGTKITDLGQKLAHDVFTPLQEQFTQTVEKATKTATKAAKAATPAAA